MVKPAFSRSPSGRALLALALASAAVPSAAHAAPPAQRPSLPAAIESAAGPALAAFYAGRGHRPLWVSPDGRLTSAAKSFVELARSSRVDEVDPYEIGLDALEAAIARLSGAQASPTEIATAETALTRSFAAFVRATRTVRGSDMVFEHSTLEVHAPAVRDALESAARAASLDDYVTQMRWLHPLYAPLRRALADEAANDAETRRILAANLERVRAIPAEPAPRYVLIDAASARLWMYENGRPVDSMRVVVGKPDLPTPMIAGYIRYAIVNPYWNVPPDLVRNRIAPNVVRGGAAYLKNARYEVLSDWTKAAVTVDPATVDWRKASRGDVEVRVRQLPSAANSMGRVKYEFPNKLGIYLHDTPDKNLMLEDARQFSSGCIRLEDADRLGRWLLKAPLPERTDAAEQRIDLPEIVPVYVTYLTAQAEGGRIALGPDPYRRDSANGRRLAQVAAPIVAARK